MQLLASACISKFWLRRCFSTSLSSDRSVQVFWLSYHNHSTSRAVQTGRKYALSLNPRVIVVKVILALIHHKVISSLSSECVVIVSPNRRPKHSKNCVRSYSLAILQRHGRCGWRATLICRFLNRVPQMFNSELFLNLSSMRVSWKLVIGGMNVVSLIGFNKSVQFRALATGISVIRPV